jgi:hypothetical protein
MKHDHDYAHVEWVFSPIRVWRNAPGVESVETIVPDYKFRALLPRVRSVNQPTGKGVLNRAAERAS